MAALLPDRSDFRSAGERVRCSPFGGVASGRRRTTEQRIQQEQTEKTEVFSLFPPFPPVKITRFPAPATNPSDDRNRSAGPESFRGCRSLRTEDAKRSSLQ